MALTETWIKPEDNATPVPYRLEEVEVLDL